MLVRFAADAVSAEVAAMVCSTKQALLVTVTVTVIITIWPLFARE